MKKTLALIVVTVLLIASLSCGVLAQGWGPGKNDCRGMYFGKNLNLTYEQQQQLLAIKQEFQKDTQSLRFDLEKKKMELRRLWTATPPDQNAINAKNSEITSLEVRMVEKIRALQGKIKAILTEEQLQKFNSGNKVQRPKVRKPNFRAGKDHRRDLGLTPEQQTKLLNIRQKHQAETQSLRFELQKKNSELKQLWKADQFDQNAINAKKAEITALKIRMAAKFQSMRAEIKNILTDEQYQKLYRRKPGS
ncbi:MAG: periplasmic heavy metal sensor [Firmicutes bacterium]|nr:periplasmic heavy metal sensor [Bacillota bacterium]